MCKHLHGEPANACSAADQPRQAMRDKTVRLTLPRLFGFLTGATTAGAGMYYYVIDEYRVSNQLLTEDIYVCLPLTIPKPIARHGQVAVQWLILRYRPCSLRYNG
jgi:hypothetical protein